MIEVRKCRAADLFNDPRSAELIAAYAEECGNALVGKPAPQLEMYEGMERSGLGQCFAAYEDGALRGFAMLIIAVVPHFGVSCASLESLFAERDASCGTDLMWAVEAHAQEAGCTAIFYSAPVASRLARLLTLRSESYHLTNFVFCRSLN